MKYDTRGGQNKSMFAKRPPRRRTEFSLGLVGLSIARNTKHAPLCQNALCCLVLTTYINMKLATRLRASVSNHEIADPLTLMT